MGIVSLNVSKRWGMGKRKRFERKKKGYSVVFCSFFPI